MTFSDEDLKRLKERAHIDSRGIMLPTEMLHALLARLEAAEAYINSRPEDINEEQIRLWKAWRKVSGKK